MEMKPVPAGAGQAERLRPELWNAHWFALFNSLSWQIVLGAPAVLYAKSLGASATVLGVMTAMMPLLVILQIPAARHLPKYGYRRFTLAGWGTRTVAIFALAAVPWVSGAGPGVRLGLMLAALLVFNTLRGLASGAWMPWLSEIVPPALRGQFLARDHVFGGVGSLASMSVAALLLMGGAAGVGPAGWQFSAVFLVSAVSAVVSLYFIVRIPDVTAPDSLKNSGHPVPWREMAAWPPFVRLIAFNLGWVAITGGLGTFTVAYLRGGVSGAAGAAGGAFSDSAIIGLSGVSILGAIVSLVTVGRMADVVGSVPVLRASLTVMVAVLAGWTAVAGGALPANTAMVAALNFMAGVSTANFGVAMSRLTMGTFPLMGRNHFFAMFSVVTHLGLGMSPIIWGIALDLVGTWTTVAAGMEWNRYALYFAAVGLLGGLTWAGSWGLGEKGPPAGSARGN